MTFFRLLPPTNSLPFMESNVFTVVRVIVSTDYILCMDLDPFGPGNILHRLYACCKSYSLRRTNSRIIEIANFEIQSRN